MYLMESCLDPRLKGSERRKRLRVVQSFIPQTSSQNDKTSYQHLNGTIFYQLEPHNHPEFKLQQLNRQSLFHFHPLLS